MAIKNKDFDVGHYAAKLFSYDPETGRICRIARMVRGQRIIPLPIPEPTCHKSNGYWRVTIFGKSIYAHRLAWFFVHGEWPDVIDHINGNGLDNRIANLRSVSAAENAQNKHIPKSNNPHKMIGVNWHKAAGKYTAQIQTNRKQKHLGMFNTAEEAQAAYVKAKREMHAFNTL